MSATETVIAAGAVLQSVAWGRVRVEIAFVAIPMSPMACRGRGGRG